MHKFVLQTFTLLSFTKTVVLDMGQELYWSWEAECDQVHSNNSTYTTNKKSEYTKISFCNCTHKFCYFGGRSAVTVAVHHLGTLALGSLILAAVRVIVVCLEWLHNRVKKVDSGWAR